MKYLIFRVVNDLLVYEDPTLMGEVAADERLAYLRETRPTETYIAIATL